MDVLKNKIIIATIATAAALAVPATSVAAPPVGKGKPEVPGRPADTGKPEVPGPPADVSAAAPQRPVENAPEAAGAPATTPAAEQPTAPKAGKTRPAKKVRFHTFVFVGRYTAPGVVEVVSGNAFARRGGFRGETLTFDLATAKVSVADVDGDGTAALADVQDGDTVVVQARLPRGTRFVEPAEGETATAIVARRLVDRTNPAVD